MLGANVNRLLAGHGAEAGRGKEYVESAAVRVGVDTFNQTPRVEANVGRFRVEPIGVFVD